MMKLKSLLHIKITGLNQEKIFNKFLDLGIDIYNLNRDSHSTASFFISPKNLNKVKIILKQNQITINNIKKFGWIKYYSTAIARLGILLGFILSIFLLIICNQFILNIRIYGNDKIKAVELVEFLNQNKIGNFTAKNFIDNDKLEFLIMQNFDEISMVSIIKKGTSLIINIKEKVLNSETEGDYKNIVSTCNGRLTYVKLIDGTLKKKEGDLIKEGDILVESYYLDSKGNKSQIKPKAEFKIEVWLEEKIIHYERTIVTEYTGREMKFRTVSLFGLELFNNHINNTYENYETKENYTRIENTFLPLIIKYTTVKELHFFERYMPFAEIKNNLMEESKQKALQKLNNNDIIKDERCTITQGTGFTVVSYLVIVDKELIYI